MNNTSFAVFDYKRCRDNPKYFIEQYLDIELTKMQSDAVTDYQFNQSMSFEEFPRQCGKTTIAKGILLHYMIFNENKIIVILTPRLAMAQCIVEDFKRLYYDLPKYLRSEVLVDNYTEFKIGNGNKLLVKSESTALNGFAIDFLLLDGGSTMTSTLQSRLTQNAMAIRTQ